MGNTETPSPKADCPDCEGAGETLAVVRRVDWRYGSDETAMLVCPACHGTGVAK